MSQTKVRTTDLVGVSLPPSRVSDVMSSVGFNRAFLDKKLEAQIKDLRTRENPNKEPVPVERLTKNVRLSKIEREERDTKVRQYNEDKKNYESYKSAAYMQAKLKFTAWQRLKEAEDLLTPKTGRNSSASTDLTKAKKDRLTAIHEEFVNPKFADETTADKKNAARVTARNKAKKNLSVVYTNVGSPKIDDLASVKAAIERLMTDPDVLLFISAAKVKQQKIKVGPAAAIAMTVLAEDVANELVAFACERTDAKGDHVIRPEHLAQPGLNKLPFYSLYADLPTLKLVQDLVNRRESYQKTRLEAKIAHDKKIKKLQKKAAEKTKIDSEFVYPTFNETEYNNGFAEKESKTNKANKLVSRYYTKGIDTESEQMSGMPYFGTYLNDMFESQIESLPKREYNLKVSSSVKKVISEILVQLVVRFSEMTGIMMRSIDANILHYTHVTAVVRMMLVQNVYPGSSVQVPAEYSVLLGNMATKAEKYREHQTTKAAAPVAVVDDL